MRIEPGQPAPDFEAQRWDGEPVALSGYRGRKLWLAFFRYASCPLCNLRVRDIIRRWDDLQAKGVDVVAVFQSPGASIAEYVGQQAPPFPLIADPEERLYALYGLDTSLAGFLSPRNAGRAARALAAGFKPGGRMEGSKTRIPGDFLIGADGVVQDAYYGEVIADHIPFERIEAFAGAKASG